jgi:UDP-N-acetylglucosamine diphosphorylase/glucosamine-1-phosphate N-acetyltransferase
MEGSVVRGGLALGVNSVLKLGTKIYGATTLGPHCKVGGEVNNSVIIGYSNKGHDGFLGNSALGEWCNLGADTNNSNLKNNYDEVKAWSYVSKRFAKTGQQFCGLIMGDHSKSGINTMFNTGTVVGVSANVYGAGFPRNFIASFTWGGPQGTMEYKLDKALDTAHRMMQRRGLAVDEVENEILQAVYEQTTDFRR